MCDPRGSSITSIVIGETAFGWVGGNRLPTRLGNSEAIPIYEAMIEARERKPPKQ